MPSSRVITAADVHLLSQRLGPDALMDHMIDRLARALATFDPSEWDIPVRSGFDYRDPAPGLLEWMPVRAPDATITVKMVGYHPHNPAQHGLPTILSTVSSYDTRTGHLLGVADATFLTALRTGAATAVATRHLASTRARTVGLIGAGAQALSQLHALSRVLEIDTVLVHDRSPEVAAGFETRVRRLGLEMPVRIVTPAGMLPEVDVLCTCTSNEVGAGPVFQDGVVRDWLHINAVGSDFAGKIEVPRSLLERAEVIPDFRAQAIVEGECQQIAGGDIGPELVAALRADSAEMRERVTTVFDSTGWALEDHVALRLLLDLADEAGLGTDLDLEMAPVDPLDPYSFPSTDAPVIPFPETQSRGSRR